MNNYNLCELNISVDGEVTQAEWDFFGDIDVDISVLIHLCFLLAGLFGDRRGGAVGHFI